MTVTCLIRTIRAGVLTAICFSTIGCSKDPFNFSEADMRTAVAGTWKGPIGSMDAGYTGDIVTLVLDESTLYVNQADASSSSTSQAIFPRRLQSCGSRRFLCEPDSTMDLAGRVSSSGGTIPTSTITGTFRVDGYDLNDLDNGNLFLTMSAGGTITASFYAGQLGGWLYQPVDGLMVSLDLTRD